MKDYLGVIKRVVGNLTGHDRNAWYERFNLALNDDPYAMQVARGKVLDVVRCRGLHPQNVLTALANNKVCVDPKITAAAERILKKLEFPHFVTTLLETEFPFVELDPMRHGVHVDWQDAANGWGRDGYVPYTAVAAVAEKYRYRQFNLFSALYLQISLLQMQNPSRGKYIYVGCTPAFYADGEDPIIPGLRYSEEKGWVITAHAAGQNSNLDISYQNAPGGSGGFSHVIVYGMPHCV